MIDFRYHLVSLVSVFLALAVGIALGAGPLKGPIATVVNSEVDSLRQAKAALRTQLDTADAGIQHRDDFTTAITPALVDKQLGGRSVVLVTVPDSDTNGVKALVSALQTAGAKVTGRVDVKSAWTDPGHAADRDQLATQLAADLPAGLDPASTTATKLDVLLSRALVTAEIINSGQTDATSEAILTALQAAGMISVDGSVAGRATEAVVLAPGVQQAVAGTAATPSPSATDSASTWRDLAATLDGGSNGVVVLGPASSAAAGGVVSSVRSDSSVAKAVSTVDTGGTPMGVIATVLALREQLSGTAGNYGFGDGAKAALPALATSTP